MIRQQFPGVNALTATTGAAPAVCCSPTPGEKGALTPWPSLTGLTCASPGKIAVFRGHGLPSTCRQGNTPPSYADLIGRPGYSWMSATTDKTPTTDLAFIPTDAVAREHRLPASHLDVQALTAELRGRVRGEVRFDDGSRALSATDASNYRQVPIGVVLPRDAEDVVQTVAAARQFGAPILAHGGGTSIGGQCCNVAVCRTSGQTGTTPKTEHQTPDTGSRRPSAPLSERLPW